MNSFNLSGRVGKLNKRYTPAGQAILTIPLGIYDGQEDGESKTLWLDVTFWGDRAEKISETVSVGDKLEVSGKITKRTWKTEEGENRSIIGFTGFNWEFTRKAGGEYVSPEEVDAFADTKEEYGF